MVTIETVQNILNARIRPMRAMFQWDNGLLVPSGHYDDFVAMACPVTVE